jgi:hypothetical protein
MMVSLGERAVMRSEFFSTFQMLISVRHSYLYPEMPRQLGPIFEPKFGKDFIIICDNDIVYTSEIKSLAKLVLSTSNSDICSKQSCIFLQQEYVVFYHYCSRQNPPIYRHPIHAQYVLLQLRREELPAILVVFLANADF